jgi:hypothetical protein
MGNQPERGAMTTRIIRVFPRRTKATPDDALAYFGPPDFFAEADEVHISVTFTYDKARAEQLAEQWRFVAPVQIGGVAFGDDSLEFIPGRYIRPGYTITSRGCPRRCWFCGVWKKWPTPNVLPIHDGWNILDDNLLACPREHVEAVFAMLRKQNRRVEFTGGLEALALEDYQVELLDARERGVPADRRGLHAAVAPVALLCADRLPERHADAGRGAVASDAGDRLLALRDAVEAGAAVAGKASARRGVASLPAALGTTGADPSRGG